MSSTVEVYAFQVSWFDAGANLSRPYRLNFFSDHTVEILNPERTKTFAKRMPVKSLNLGMLYIGAAVSLNSRQYHVVDYADLGTRTRFEAMCGKSFGIIKPSGMHNSGEVLNAIKKKGFVIADVKTVMLSSREVKEWYPNDVDMEEGVVMAVLATSMTASTDGAVEIFNELCRDLEGRFGFGGMYASDSADQVSKDSNKFFGPGSLPNSFMNTESTLCLIKPHILKSGELGQMISKIQNAGFDIACAQMFYLNRECACEFYDCYRGVLPQYSEMVGHLSEGPCVALQIIGNGNDRIGIVEKFREYCGPVNVELAKTIRPESVRAVFGKNGDFAQNGVHCTDLPEDGGLETKYFFDILAQI